MKCIPRYDGSGGAQRLFDYIDQFEDFAMNMDYTPEMELTLATAKLNGDAKAWWRDHRNTFPIDHQQRIRYWTDLRKALIEHFAPPEHAYNIRNKLFSLQQKGSVADYNASFTRLKQQLTDLGDSDAIFAYLRGLSSKIRELVWTQKDNQADLRTLQNACLRVDTSQPNRSNNQSTPHEEAHNISLNQNQNFNRGGSRRRSNYRHRGHGSRNRESNNGAQPYKKNTTDRMKNQNAKFSCPICDATDHAAFKCPNLTTLRETLNKSHPSANQAIGATIIDSGATQHMFYELDDLTDVTQNNTTITCANSQELQSTHIGSIDLTDELNLKNVLCVPDLQHNLISVRALNKSGNDVIFKNDGTVINVDETDKATKIGQTIGDLFHLSTGEEAYLANSTRTFDEYALWHHRLGHPSRKVLRTMTKYVTGLDNIRLIDPMKICTGCACAKSHRQPFGSAISRSS